MTQQEMIYLVRETVAGSNIDASVTPSNEGGWGPNGKSCIIETDDARYTVVMDPSTSRLEKGWIHGDFEEKSGGDTRNGYLSSGEMTKTAWKEIWKAIERQEEIFAEQHSFYAGWDSAEDAQQARVSEALDQAKAV